MNDWDDIRYFLAIARSGNVTAASKVLGVNHSTVSRRIRALEEKYGVRLFERIQSGYEMTVAATGIFELALDLESKNQQVSRLLFGQDSLLAGEINLTMPHDIFEFCLSGALSVFRELQPGIVLNLSVSKGLRNLAAREADVAIRLTNAPPDYLIGKRVAQLQHGIYVNPKSILHDRTPIIVWIGETDIPSWAQDEFPNAEIVLRVDDLFSMYCAVKAGIGLARIPCYLPDSIQDEQVKRLNIDIPKSSWGIWVLSHVDLRGTARVRCCREFLIEKLTQNKNLFEGDNSVYLDASENS